MSKPYQRVVAFITAVLFLAISVAGGVYVIWQVRKDNELAKEISKTSSTETATQTPTNQNTQEEKDMLQGTKLENFTPVDKIDSLQKLELSEGTGEEVKPGATVTAHYTGALAKDGTIFQSSHDFGQAIEFSLAGVIKGWTDGVPGMKVGGKRRLLIPAAQAYGATGNSGIPPNSDLVFDIEITAVKNP